MRHILYETEDSREILTGLSREDGETPEEGYWLSAGIITEQKGGSKEYMTNSYAISVVPVPGDPEPRLYVSSGGGTMYNSKGEEIGHGEPTGEVMEGGEFARKIYDYYLAHKEQVLTTVTTPDLSRFNPLLRLDNWTALLAVRRVDSLPLKGDGDVMLECEFVATNRVVDYQGNLQSWRTFKKLIHIIPVGEGYIHSRVKEFPALCYEYGRPEPQVLEPHNPDWESYSGIYPNDKMIFDYYQATVVGSTSAE